MSERKAYLVTEGAYSDYRVYAVFDDEALATAWRGAYCRGGEVEEFELNPHSGELRMGLHRWLVRLWRDGDVLAAQVHGFEGTPADRWAWAVVSVSWNASQVALRRLAARLEPALCFESHLVAPDEVAAVKVANERRARSVAAGEADVVPRGEEVGLYWHDTMRELVRRGIWGGKWLVKSSYPEVIARGFPSRVAAIEWVGQRGGEARLWVEPEASDEEA